MADADITVEESQLPLQSAYRWECEKAGQDFLIQPTGEGGVQAYTWREAMTQARSMANYLKAQQFPEHSAIAIFGKNSAHFFIADLAIWMAGHVSVPIYPTSGSDTLAYILDQCEAKAIFLGRLDHWDSVKTAVPGDLIQVALPYGPSGDMARWDELIAANEPISDSPVRDGDELATIIYTSGSTGNPKGVMMNFRSMIAPSIGSAQVFGIREGDCLFSYLPLAAAYERSGIEMTALLNGVPVYFSWSLETFNEDLKRAKPSIFLSVPRLWLKFQSSVLAQLPQEQLDELLENKEMAAAVKTGVLEGLGLQNVRLAASGSAPIPAEILRWYRRLGLELLEGYSMTENFSYCHVSRPNHNRVGYVGETMPGVQVKISEEGEVLMKGPAMMMGYYKQPELTAEAFSDDEFLRTGDRGEIDEEGRLKLTGRVKELFKTSKGKYIAPSRLENLINADPLVEICCVSGAGRPQPATLCPGIVIT